MTDGSAEPLPPMIDHWWWRPGWSAGRRFYTWHLTFRDAPDALRVAHEYEEHLRLPGLDVIPDAWLHLTMQGLGFVDEVDPAEVDRIVAAARRRLAGLSPFDVGLGPTVVDPEVVRLRVTPADPVRQLRDELRTAIAEVWGDSGVPEAADGFDPHVSLAYSNRSGEMAPILAAATAVDPPPGRVTVAHADLIVLHRDHRQYEWTTHTEVPLGESPP